MRNTYGIWAVILYDMLVMAGFIGMSCLFNHWWISLFGLLFILKYTNKDDNKNEEDDE